MNDAALRAQLITLLDWHDAHASFDQAVADFPLPARGRTPAGAPHSPWQLLEHIRITQQDILDFCVSAGYEEREWPAGYWPPSAAPPSATAWDDAIAACRRDRDALRQLARDPQTDLFAPIPHGSGQTCLRELLLVADHTAYHVGQLVIVRRLLGVWGEE
jgi:uncharacterized damage-inducible protein DinB